MEYNIMLLVISLTFIGQIDTEQFKPTLVMNLIQSTGKQRVETIGNIYYVVVGAFVNFDCSPHWSDERRANSLKFFHDGKQLDTKYNFNFKMKLESRGIYYCMVAYNNGISPASKSFHLEVNLKPSIIYNATEGENAKFVCSVTINTNITFAWYLNQQRRKGENKKELVLENINRTQDGDRITCEVLLNNKTLRDATETIKVHWLEVNLTGKSNITLGQQLNLQCNSNSNPSVSQITWFKDANKLSTTNNTFQVIATKSDAGTYSCNAKTDYHDKKSNKISVTVQYKPSVVQIKPEGNHLEVSITQNNYVIECETTDIGVPSGTVAWYKNGNAHKSTHNGKRLVLNFITLTRNDTGDYKCMASNRIGSESKTVKLSVLERPDKLVVTSNSTSNSITVSWQEPFNGNKPIRQYKLQLSANNNSESIIKNNNRNNNNDNSNNNNNNRKNSNDNSNNNLHNYYVFEYVVGDNVTKYIFKNLSANVNYSLTVRARNKIGWSSSTVKHIATRESRPTQPRDFIAEHKEQEKSLHLKWLIPSPTNGELIHYLICYYPLFEITHQLCVTTKSLEYELKYLRPYTKYNLTICGRTSKGYGTNATVTAQTEIEAPPPYTDSLPRIPLQSVAIESIKVPMVHFSTNHGPILCYDMVSIELADHSTPTEHPNSYLNLRNKTFMESHDMIVVARISNMTINRNILVKSIANVTQEAGMKCFPITIKPNTYYSFFIRAYTMLGPNTMKFTSTSWYEPIKTKAQNKDEIDNEGGKPISPIGVLTGVLVTIFVLIAFLILVVVRKRDNVYNVRFAEHKFGLLSLRIINNNSYEEDDVDENTLQKT